MADHEPTRTTEPARDPAVEIAHRKGADLADTEVGTITPATRKRGGGVPKWIWIALAVVVALLLFSWLFVSDDGPDEVITGARAGDVETLSPVAAD